MDSWADGWMSFAVPLICLHSYPPGINPHWVLQQLSVQCPSLHLFQKIPSNSCLRDTHILEALCGQQFEALEEEELEAVTLTQVRDGDRRDHSRIRDPPPLPPPLQPNSLPTPLPGFHMESHLVEAGTDARDTQSCK